MGIRGRTSSLRLALAFALTLPAAVLPWDNGAPAGPRGAALPEVLLEHGRDRFRFSYRDHACAYRYVRRGYTVRETRDGDCRQVERLLDRHGFAGLRRLVERRAARGRPEEGWDRTLLPRREDRPPEREGWREDGRRAATPDGERGAPNGGLAGALRDGTGDEALPDRGRAGAAIDGRDIDGRDGVHGDRARADADRAGSDQRRAAREEDRAEPDRDRAMREGGRGGSRRDRDDPDRAARVPQPAARPAAGAGAATPPGAGARIAAAGRGSAGAPGAPSPGLIRPIAAPVTTKFGERVDGARLQGIRFEAAPGTPVVSAADGEVMLISRSTGALGTLVMVRHPDLGLTSVYARVGEVLVGRGDAVRQGTPLASVAPAPEGEAAHLHFELREGPVSVDPERLFAG